MRGADEQTGSMFSYVSLEERIPRDHPVRAVRGITDRALARMTNAIRHAVREIRPAVDSSREAASRAVAAGAVYDSRRAPVDGADPHEALIVESWNSRPHPSVHFGNKAHPSARDSA